MNCRGRLNSSRYVLAHGTRRSAGTSYVTLRCCAQALKEPDHDEAVRYASELIEASIDTARQKGWKGFTKQEEEGGPAAEDADEAFLSDFLDKMDSPQKSLGHNAGAPSADGAKVDDARAKAHAQLVRKGLLKNSLKTIVNTNRMLRRKRGSDAGPRTDAMATLAAALSSSSGVSTQFAEMSGEEGEGASAEQSGSADEELASSSAQSSAVRASGPTQSSENARGKHP